MGELRILTERDKRAIRRVLRRKPVDNVVVASRFELGGVTSFGNPLLGWYQSGSLTSMLSDGYTLTPVEAVPAAVDAFARYEERRRATSIFGSRDETMALWEKLCQLSYTQWAHPREVRDHQRVMVIDDEPLIQPEARVEPVGTRYLASYFAAAQAMYSEEVGVAPVDLISYRRHIATLMTQGRAFGLVDEGRIVFKADVTANVGDVAQISGVWLSPDRRQHHLSATLVAGVVAQVRERWPVVTLYVNSYNLRAIACYESVGFRPVSECATILY